jgi:hypothetical protein
LEVETFMSEKRWSIATSSDDGRPLAVFRPAKPDVAIAFAKAALSSQNTEIFEGLPEKECGPYTFVGWMAAGSDEGILVDGEGNEVGRSQPGDSFVTLENES